MKSEKYNCMKDRQQALQDIKEILVSISAVDEPTASKITEETELLPDMIDSIDSVGLIIQLERKAEICIPDAEAEKVYGGTGKVSDFIDLYLKYANVPKALTHGLQYNNG
jgi:acyl carrier protein